MQPRSLGRMMIPPSVFLEEISEYLRDPKSDRLEIFTGERYRSSCLNGRTYISANTTIMAEIIIK
jgi:hypothetical protein